MSLDFLARAREKIKNKEVDYLIPYHYILLGKKIIQNSKTMDLLEAFALTYDKSDLIRQAKRNPLKYYENFKVCYRCYQIYLYIMKKNQLSPIKTVPIKHVKGKMSKNCVDSELGIINKDNIDDLLLDMSFYLASTEMECDDRVKNMYSSMTEINQSIANQNNSSVIHTRHNSIYGLKQFPSQIESLPVINIEVPKAQPRRSRRIMSKVGEFYIGKPKRLGKRLILK